MAKKKTLLIIPMIIIITVIISLITPMSAYADESSYEPRLSAPNSSISYYSRVANVYFQNGSGMPNCVAYAYGRIYEMNGEMPKITHGSAGDWWFINKNHGYYAYGQEPKLGAVACWSNHVAVVERVNENGSVTLSESHWHGKYFDTVTYGNVQAHYGQRFYGYIYTYNNGVTEDLKDKLIEASNGIPMYKQEKITTAEATNQFNIMRLNTETEITYNVNPFI